MRDLSYGNSEKLMIKPPLVTRCSHISLGKESRKPDNFMQQGQHSKGEETQALFQLLEPRKKQKRRKSIWKGWNMYSTPEAQNVTHPQKSQLTLLRNQLHFDWTCKALCTSWTCFLLGCCQFSINKREEGFIKQLFLCRHDIHQHVPTPTPSVLLYRAHPHPLSGSL